MRLKLKLRCRPNSVISMNYTYALQAVIYKILERADPVFSHWLHEKGYDSTGKNFKLFTFDLLRGYFRNDYDQQTIRFIDGNIEWRVSFCVDQAVEKFVTGLFHNQVLEIVTPDGRLDCVVQQVEILPPPTFKEDMQFRAIMPICIAENSPESRHAQYRSPDDAQFNNLFMANLHNKYRAAFPDNAQQATTTPLPYSLRILTPPRKKGFSTYKRSLDRPTHTIGYTFDFAINAPTEWLKVAYFGGFGKSCSSGFGFCEVIE